MMAVSGRTGTPAAVGMGDKIPASKLLQFSVKSFRKPILCQIGVEPTVDIRQALVSEMEALPTRLDLLPTSVRGSVHSLRNEKFLSLFKKILNKYEAKNVDTNFSRRL